MRRALEFLMYLAFSLAALPFAWFGTSSLLYYRAHPEMLEVRDSAPEALGVIAAIPFMIGALVVAGATALYFLVKGPRAARINVSILVTLWFLPFILVPETPFRSFARLYWDALPFVALSVAPWACAAVRMALRNKAPVPS